MSYRIFVKYTFIGNLLNDARTKNGDLKLKSELKNFRIEL